MILSLLRLVGQLEAALARIAELEARLALLDKPPKTPDNSSLPPSKGHKASQPGDDRKPPRKGRRGFGRALAPNPDRIVDLRPDACPRCAAAWPAAPQTPQQAYDRIELPPVKPDTARVRLFGGRCACCGERAVAAAPAGLEPGSPFGKSIEAIAVCLHDAQAIGLERLRLAFGELFGLSISEGAPCNILARAMTGSRPRSNGGCCVRLPSGGGAIVCSPPRWRSVAPIWTAGSTRRWRRRDADRPPRSCVVASPAIASICSRPSPIALCPPPTMPASARCVRA